MGNENLGSSLYNFLQKKFWFLKTILKQNVLLVLSSNLEKSMSHMTGAGSSARAAAASAAAIAATTTNAVVPMQ